MTTPTHGPVKDFHLADKLVLITGGGSGIGLAFTQHCINANARVLIGDLKLTPEAEQYASTVPKDKLIFEHCDVTSWASLKSLITSAIKHFGTVPDVYAPVAGVLDPKWSNFWDDTESDFYKTVRINTEHPMKLTRLAIRALLSENKRGVVMLVASSAGIRGNYFVPLYAATKHSIMGLTKSLAQADPEEGVKIVCVMPGTVKSNLWEDRDDHVLKATRYEERKLMGPEVIAEVMGRMVTEGRYSGGTCVLKTYLEERVVEEGWDAEKGYDPSPRPEADYGYQRGVLEGERGRKWEG